jgi:hypothetical protein
MFSAQAHKSHRGYKVVENCTVFQDLQGLVRVMRLCGGETRHRLGWIVPDPTV